LPLAAPGVSPLSAAIALSREPAWAAVAASLGTAAASAHAIPIGGVADRTNDADPQSPQKSTLLGTRSSRPRSRRADVRRE
jgi:hypothetical protein